MIPLHVERRQIAATLAPIHELAKDAQDEATQKMITWLQEFTSALRTNAPLQPIIEKYQAELSAFLHERVDDAFEAEAPDAYDMRPVRLLLDQILDPRSLLHTDEIEQAFGHLRREVLSEQDQKIQRIMARNRQRAENVAQEARELRQEFAAVTGEILGEFAALRLEDQEAVQRDLQATEALKQKDAEQLKIIKHAIKKRETAIEALKERNKELKESLRITDGQITATERSNAQLKIAINEAQAAMQEKQKSWLEAALMIGAAIGLSLLLPQLLPGMSASVGAGTAKSTVPAFWMRFSTVL